jgi:hypothetical protein
MPRKKERLTPRGQAFAWWEARISERHYVGPKSELPGGRALGVLRDEELIAETPGGWAWVVLGRDAPDGDRALRHNYWSLVQVLLAEYAPAEVCRVSAVRLLAGDMTLPEVLQVRHGANRSRHRTEVASGAEVALEPDDLLAEGVVEPGTVQAGSVTLPVTSPERTLVQLTAGDISHNRDLVLSWLRSLVVARLALDAAYAASPRHVLLARVGHLAEDVGNRRLAEQIKSVLTAYQRHHVSRSDTGVGSELVVPAYITSSASTRDPGQDRLQARLTRGAEVVRDVMSAAAAELSSWSLSKVLGVARASKVEDTYHSTTIEGYRITRDEVRAVIEGRPYDGRSPGEIERMMALKGYSRAFDRTLELIEEALNGAGPELSESLIFDLYLELWGPSIDEGIVSTADMRSWRTSPVFIRGSRYVPPGPEKVASYMTQLVTQMNGLDVDPLTRCVLTHWGFVHIHPFMDGSGRLARLLMNYVLAGSGLPWTTIRAEQRAVYFAALDRVHTDDEFIPFAEFIRGAIEHAVGTHSGGRDPERWTTSSGRT